MKIITDKLTPLFDQYRNNENRLTHALLHTIGGSERILRLFLKKVIGLKGKMGVLEVEVSTQKRPFSHEETDPDKVDSVPDAWVITPDSKLGIVIEVKDVKNNVRFGQLRSHIKRLEGYDARGCDTKKLHRLNSQWQALDCVVIKHISHYSQSFLTSIFQLTCQD